MQGAKLVTKNVTLDVTASTFRPDGFTKDVESTDFTIRNTSGQTIYIGDEEDQLLDIPDGSALSLGDIMTGFSEAYLSTANLWGRSASSEVTVVLAWTERA